MTGHHASLERRSHTARVPMDPDVVQVTFLDWGETTEASAINLAEGGLSLRASLLPDVGSELRCAVPMPDGGVVEADCEVVWAQHDGPYAGEFGLRFVDLSGADEAKIRAYVEARAERARRDGPSSSSLDRASNSADPASVARDPEAREAQGSIRHPAEAREALSAQSAARPQTTLRLDGIPTPIHAEVVHEDGDVLVVEQELPFLRQGMGVRESLTQLRGRLASVGVRVEGETPRLVLTVHFENAPGAAQDSQRAATGYLAPEAPPVETAVSARSEPVELESSDDTLPDSDADADLGEAEVRSVATAAPAAADEWEPPAPYVVDCRPAALRREADRHEDHDEGPLEEAPFAIDELPPAPSPVTAEPEMLRGHHAENDAHNADADAEELFFASSVTPSSATDEDASLDAESLSFLEPATPVARMAAGLRESATKLRSKAGPGAQAAREKSAVLAQRARPALAALFARLVALFGALKERARPALAALLARVRGGARAAVTKRGEARQQRPLRTQRSRLHPGGAATRAASSAPTLAPERARRRTVVLSALAFCVVALLVYALTPSSDSETTTSASDAAASSAAEPSSSDSENTTSNPVSSGSSTPSAPTPSGGAISPYTANVTTPTPAAATAPTPAPATPAAPSGPAPGPLEAPTYPSLGDASPQAPGSVPEESPYAEGASDETPTYVEGDSFGAEDVPRARDYTITMSVPVGTLRGRELDNGFEVIIPGSLARGPAGPIARSHAHVARSRILNHGDHATLTIEFVEGRSPAYRVSARGTQLQIAIGR